MRRFLFYTLALTLTFPLFVSGNTLRESKPNFRFSIDQVQSYLGSEVELSVRNISEPPKPGAGKGTAIGSFSFLINYDASQLELLSIRPGKVLTEQGWGDLAIMTYIACSSGVDIDSCDAVGPVRIQAAIQRKNEVGHSDFSRQNIGEWLVLKFKVKEDCRLSGQVLPVSWYWENCNDNTLKNFPGNRVWVADSLINSIGHPIDLKTAFSKDISNCDTLSLESRKTHVERAITFVNGGVRLQGEGKKFQLVIDTVSAYQGTDVEVGIRNVDDAVDPSLLNGKSVGGFSLLLSYDCACLQFLSARKGTLLVNQGWEFFTYRFGAVSNGNCGSGCPACLIRIVGISDVNNGDLHPNLTRENQGEWAVLKFRTSNDRRLAGQLCQINWFWFDCTDNMLSDSTGQRVWVVDSLYSYSGSPIDLATAFPNNVSACTTSLVGKMQPKKYIIFANGGIQLPSPSSIDNRGDLNLNGLSYEISDFVLFKNYLLYGDVVLSPDSVLRQLQIANSDVNGDGLPSALSDLVAMARIITGDANPLPTGQPQPVYVNFTKEGQDLIVTTTSNIDLGGLYLRLNLSGTKGAPTKLDSAVSLELAAGTSGSDLRLLLVASEKDARIPAGTQRVLSIPYDGTLEPVGVEASTYYGQSLPVFISVPTDVQEIQRQLPKSFSLSQNFPNPFNPSTSFTLSLPKAGRYSVRIYNLTGQVVKTFEGEASAGTYTLSWDGTDQNGAPVSSGIYFYKAQVGKHVLTKRMVLIR